MMLSEIAWVYESIRHSEGRTIGHHPHNPYWFVEHQIAGCRANLAEGRPKKAFAQNLDAHNHGHSGFTGIAVRVYFGPRNDDERRLSSVLRQLHIDVAKALLVTTKPANVAWEYVDVEVNMLCLWRLGGNAPDELVTGLKELLGGCVAMENPWQYSKGHLEQVNERFP